MLTQLAIQDFAIVDHLELDLTDGMTAITGETGAGKSILLGALGLCLVNALTPVACATAASAPTSPHASIFSICPPPLNG
jgi:recombinational DNA repair ATPase RecF